MNNTEAFLDLYKQLEVMAVKRYNYPPDGTAVSKLEKRPEFRTIQPELTYCREVRNLLQHNPKVGGAYPVSPSDEMISLLKATIDKVKNPPRVKDIAIPIKSILYKTMDDYVRPTMIEMQENVFTHIPILRDGVVIGVFSENTLFSYLVDTDIVAIEDDMRFSELIDYLPIDKHRAETFRFLGQTKLVSDVNNLFEDALSKQDRIGLVFITKSGDAKEPLLGILTAWDIAGAK